MSENSESVHVWQRNASEVSQIARLNGINGRIVASNERWTCFIPFEDGFSELFAKRAKGFVVVWKYADDFGLWISAFDAGRELGTLAFEWGALSRPVSQALLEWLKDRSRGDAMDDLLGLAAEVGPLGRKPREVRDAVAGRLGLPAYDWLSPHYARDTPIEEIQDEFPDAEDIL